MGGEPDLPIEMTEIGWPRAPDGTGAASAFDGYVGDASRAATTALSADALAASDCNVKNYIVYSLVEEQRNAANPEDWLGVIDRNGQPTETLNALVAAARRHAARPASLPMLPMCSGPTLEGLRSIFRRPC